MGGGASITSVGATAVSVAVIPGTDVGRTQMVAVGVGAGRVGVLVACSWPELVASEADSVRNASLLDIKPVKATYSPSTTTSRTMRKPKAYPLFIQSTVPVMKLNTIGQHQSANPLEQSACQAFEK